MAAGNNVIRSSSVQQDIVLALTSKFLDYTATTVTLAAATDPSRSLSSADIVLPSVPDVDIYELPADNELLSMLDMFEKYNTLVFAKGDK